MTLQPDWFDKPHDEWSDNIKGLWIGRRRADLPQADDDKTIFSLLRRTYSPIPR